MNLTELLNLELNEIISIIIFILGVALLIQSLWWFFKSNETEKWIFTKGQIIESERKIERSSNNSMYTYNALIEYKYWINDQEFQSNRIYFGSNISTSAKKEKSERLTREYPFGKEVSVYYDPMNHNLSVLEKGVHSEVKIVFAISIVLIIVGIVAFVI
jgi:hypothetical protein